MKQALRLVWLLPVMASLVMAEPVTDMLGRVSTAATSSWAPRLAVLGVLFTGGRVLFADHHSHEAIIKTAMGGTILLGASALASFLGV